MRDLEREVCGEAVGHLYILEGEGDASVNVHEQPITPVVQHNDKSCMPPICQWHAPPLFVITDMWRAHAANVQVVLCVRAISVRRVRKL